MKNGVQPHIEIDSFPKPNPKSHLFMKKYQKVNVLDKQLRKKWLQINQDNKRKIYNAKQEVKQEAEANSRLQIINDKESDMIIGHRLKKVESMKEQKKQIEAKLRIKHYEEKYYSKKSLDLSDRKRYHTEYQTPNKQEDKIESNIAPIQKKDVLANQKLSYKKQSDLKLPLMLRQRSDKTSKQLRIISFQYKWDLQKIKIQGNLGIEKSLESRKNLINKIKNSHVYYKMLQQWSPQKAIMESSQFNH